MTNLDLQNENSAIKNTVKNIERKICDYLTENNLPFLNLTDSTKDAIYSYDYYRGDELRELQVLAVYALTDNEKPELALLVSSDLSHTKFDEISDDEISDMLNGEDDRYCYVATLFGGNLLGYFTAVNLAENINEYLK